MQPQDADSEQSDMTALRTSLENNGLGISWQREQPLERNPLQS